MLRTYRAIIKADRIEWTQDAPDATSPLHVHVTVLDPLLSPTERGRAMAEALDQLASRNSLADLQDPAAWQHAVRSDRPLPERRD